MARNKNKQRCTARTAKGARCGAWARRGSDLPRCRMHGKGGFPQGGKRRCTAITTTNGATQKGERCRQWAMAGRDVCNVHAGLHLPGDAERAAGRGCSFVGADGRRCRGWAMPGTDPPLCLPHSGEARPAPEARRCTASTTTGERCAQYGIWGTEARYGRLLCANHLPAGDARKTALRFPGEGERRCRALTLEGERCRHWAMADDGLPAARKGLCKMHAFPEQHSQLRHGYFWQVAYFPHKERAFIAATVQKGEPLAAELVVTRLRLRRINAYLARLDLTVKERDRGTRLLLRAAGTVVNLATAQYELEVVGD